MNAFTYFVYFEEYVIYMSADRHICEHVIYLLKSKRYSLTGQLKDLIFVGYTDFLVTEHIFRNQRSAVTHISITHRFLNNNNYCVCVRFFPRFWTNA